MSYESESIDDDQFSCSDMSMSIESPASPMGDTRPPSRFNSPTRSPSPAASVISVSSTDRQQFLRNVHGRIFNAHNEGWLYPADQEEQTRLDLQHAMVTEALGSLYPAQDLVLRALAPKQNVSPEILDVGTGSGSWAIDIAKEFSHAGVVGIDLVPPMIEGRAIPPNVRFEIDDVNLSMTHYTKCFDFVHCRCVCSGIRDFQSLIYSLAQTLRPNGVLIMVHASLELYDQNYNPLPTIDEGLPGFFPLQNILQACARLQVPGGCSAANWRQMLEQNPNFTGADTQYVHIPIGPFQPNADARMLRVAQLSQYNTYQFVQAVRPMLLENGYDEALINRWIELASLDIQRATYPAYVRWEYAWAVRKNTKWKPQHQGQPGRR